MSTKEEKFLESLRDYIKYCGRAGEILDSIMSEKVSSEEGFSALRNIKREGRTLQTQLIERLYKAFKTPSLANEAKGLVVRLDLLINGSKDVANTLSIFDKGEKKPEGIVLMAKLNKHAVIELVKIINYTVDVTANYMKMEARCQKIYSMEERGDDTYRETLSDLFYKNNDVMYALRWKEILVDLESILDACAGIVPRFQRLISDM